MNDKKDWDPNSYLKFDKERIQPSIDLASRIKFDNPSRIIDIGCGPGNSTQVILQKWPGSAIIGIDNSKTMIEKAKKDYPEQNWEILDAGKDEIPGTYDIIFSNSTIQWIPNHDDLLKKFHRSLNDDGLIAIQIPMFWDMPIGKSIKKISRDKRWNNVTKGVTELLFMPDYSYYFDQLSRLYNSINIWETEYMHIMDSHFSILDMIRSTGLRPYLDSFDKKEDQKNFENQVLNDIKKEYAFQKNGKVIFPFKRLFFIAYK